MKNCVLSALVILLCAVAACNRDPNVAKKNYVEKGNKFFENGKYKEALIMYRKALQRDLKYGEAYYRSGLTEIALKDPNGAVRDLSRAVELLPDNLDAHDKLAAIYLMAAASDTAHRKGYLDELRGIADKETKQFPNSYEEARLRGYIAVFDNNGKAALQFFEKANRLKPNQPDVASVYMQTLASQGQIEEAEKLGTETLNKNPTALGIYDVLYILYAKQNKPEEAEKVRRMAVEKNPKEIRPRLDLALHYFAVKNRDQMLNTLATIENDPATFPKGLLDVGDFLNRLGDFELAAQKYRLGSEKYPKEKARYNKRLIEVLIRQNKKDEATQLVTNILKDDPKDAEGLALRASLTLMGANKEQLQSAINDLQSAVTQMPQNEVVRYNLGRALFANQNIDAARVQFEEAIKLQPRYELPRLALTQMMIQRGDFGKAAQMAQEIQQLNPRNIPAQLLRSRALIGLGNMKQAREELTRTKERYPNLPDARLQLAALDLQDKSYKSAEDSFRQLYGESKDPRAFMGLVDTYVAQGQMATALKMLQDELAKDPNRMEYHVAVAHIAAATKDYPTAISELKTVLGKAPQNAQLWIELSEVYRRAGDFNSAVDASKKAQQVAPNNAGATLQMAMLYETSGQRTESKPYYEQVLKLQPDNPVALNNLAFILAEAGTDLDQALTMAQRAKQQRPQDDDVADTLGWIYIKKNIPDSAVPIFRDLVSKNPNRSTYRYHLAMAYFQKGDKINAKKECEAALKTSNDQSESSRIKELMSRIG